ncbi:MAG: LacI family DNA-binding transcriptional regulator [Phycisphaeraceae bacterium JB051]
MAVTIQNIADELNISVSTVSRSLRNDRVINPQTRAKIQAAAMDMGYQGRIRRKQQRASSKQLKFVAVFTIESLQLLRNDSNYLRYMEGLEAEADAMNAKVIYEALPYDARQHMEKKKLPKSIRTGKPNAIICVGQLSEQNAQMLSEFAPIISLMWDYDPTPCDVVLADESKAFSCIVDHLVELGHRNIRWIGEYDPQHLRRPYRFAGYIAGCLKNNLNIDNQQVNESMELYRGMDLPYMKDHTNGITQPQLLNQWITEQNVTALICQSDRVAHNILLNLKQLDIDVPNQVSVTGFDDQPTPQGLKRLTTFDGLIMEQARTAMRVAQQRIERPTAFPQRILHLTRLITGDTTAPPRDLS